MTTFSCPLCQKVITDNNILGTTALCSCGWHGPLNFHDLKRKDKLKKRIEKMALLLSLLAAAFCFYEWRHWGMFFSNHLVIETKILTGTAREKDWVDLGVICNTLQRYECSERAFDKILKYEPDNLTALSNLAMAQTQLGKHADALKNYEAIFSKGDGAADTMAFYGMSLESLGRAPEAEKWYYRALSIEPELVDVTDRLLNILVQKKSYVEALSLIGNVSALVPTAQAYFQNRLITISDLLQLEEKGPVKVKSFRIASLQDHHFLPIQFPGAHTVSFFLVDTGATLLTVNPQFMADQKIEDYSIIDKIEMRMASGEVVEGTRLIFKHIIVGPWQLENVQAAVCDDCMLLAGKSVLKLFTMTTKENDGIEFLTLSR